MNGEWTNLVGGWGGWVPWGRAIVQSTLQVSRSVLRPEVNAKWHLAESMQTPKPDRMSLVAGDTCINDLLVPQLWWNNSETIFESEGNDEIGEAGLEKTQFGQLYKLPGFIDALIPGQLSSQQQHVNCHYKIFSNDQYFKLLNVLHYKTLHCKWSFKIINPKIKAKPFSKKIMSHLHLKYSNSTKWTWGKNWKRTRNTLNSMPGSACHGTH